jgi:hypothetical protein
VLEVVGSKLPPVDEFVKWTITLSIDIAVCSNLEPCSLKCCFDVMCCFCGSQDQSWPCVSINCRLSFDNEFLSPFECGWEPLNPPGMFLYGSSCLDSLKFYVAMDGI